MKDENILKAIEYGKAGIQILGVYPSFTSRSVRMHHLINIGSDQAIKMFTTNNLISFLGRPFHLLVSIIYF